MRRLALSLIVLVSLTGCEVLYFGLVAETNDDLQQYCDNAVIRSMNGIPSFMDTARMNSCSRYQVDQAYIRGQIWPTN